MPLSIRVCDLYDNPVLGSGTKLRKNLNLNLKFVFIRLRFLGFETDLPLNLETLSQLCLRHSPG